MKLGSSCETWEEWAWARAPPGWERKWEDAAGESTGALNSGPVWGEFTDQFTDQFGVSEFCQQLQETATLILSPWLEHKPNPTPTPRDSVGLQEEGSELCTCSRRGSCG